MDCEPQRARGIRRDLQLDETCAAVDANNTARGGEAILTFQVPNESDKGALTTQFSVALPNVTSATTELMPGWTSRLDRDTAAGIVRSVTWTVAPGVGVPPDQFALFRVAVTLPNTDMVSFPATQTYNDTTVVRWDQPPLPGGGEPEHPVPTLTLTAAPSEGVGQNPSPLYRRARRPPPRRPRRQRHPTTPHVGWPAPHWSSAGLGWDWRWSCGDGHEGGGVGAAERAANGPRADRSAHGVGARHPHSHRPCGRCGVGDRPIPAPRSTNICRRRSPR